MTCAGPEPSRLASARLSSRPSRDSIALLCFPHAGGSAAFFQPWASNVAPAVRVVPMQYPGRGHRQHEPPCTSMAELASSQLGSVAEHLAPDRAPLALWGHSLGARVAFEVAAACTSTRGRSPAHLFLSACPPPHRRVTRRRSQLPDDELVAAIAELDSGSLAALTNPLLRLRALRLLRADLAIFESHVPSSARPLSSDITVFGGRDDSAAPLEHLRGWELWTRGRVRYVEFAGGHFFVRDHRDAVARHILAALAAGGS